MMIVMMVMMIVRITDNYKIYTLIVDLMGTSTSIGLGSSGLPVFFFSVLDVVLNVVLDVVLAVVLVIVLAI